MAACSTSKVAERPKLAVKISPAEALAKLKEGNERFVANHLKHPHQDRDRRSELATGQQPFAIVLGCADSRTSPEVVFDQGLGDIFVVRVAGNVLNDETIGSIEYAVEHLGANLIVVLGHERCGAVKAAKETLAAHGTAPGHIQSLVKAIKPAVDSTKGKELDETIKANVRNVANSLKHSDPVLHHEVDLKKIAVVGAEYDLDTGAVEFLQ